ncbi:MAG: lipid IV(A) 3-deoxy-D-manno-octulosonic acid transferase [Pseudomonadales bacterium]
MWRWLYRVLLLLAWPWVRVRLWMRARREPEYGERIGERFGRVPPGTSVGCVWFHTVSAGETIAAAPLIARLADEFSAVPFLVTTMTPTGSAQVRARLGARVDHCYAPYDFPWAVRRFYDRVRPRLLVLMETELWPNLIAEGARRGVPVLLVNARLSERSARGYARIGGLTREMLTQVRWLACQYPEHRRRFLALGAPAERVSVLGNVKFDVALPDDHGTRVAVLERRFGISAGSCWIAASTHAGEEDQVLTAHAEIRRALPTARLVLVPRHPARASEVATLCHAHGFSCARVSEPRGDDVAADVVLGDTMGELLYLYGLAGAAFVGGSLDGGGGHNPIEPSLCGVPVAMGPAVFNFADVVEPFRSGGCLELVTDAASLARVVGSWLADPGYARQLGARARALVAENRGASARLQVLVAEQIRAAGAADGVALNTAAPRT